MKTFDTISQIRQELAGTGSKKIGFVPTMGYLHEGHLSLIRKAVADNDYTVVSIYVNPTQFGPAEDLEKYPRDLARDQALLEELKVDYLFYPEDEEMYQEGFQTSVQVATMAKVLCGITRPHHFRGVCTVVLKLFNIIGPAAAYFGAKDAQQAIILKRMVRDLNVTVKIRVLPIVRDQDGLALSSRNAYLSEDQRRQALLFPRGLQEIREEILSGETDVRVIEEKFLDKFTRQDQVKVEYISMVSLDSLSRLEKIEENNTLVAAAVKVGPVRLIDNFILGEI
jgi:pantoate--beta-alanine ligase